MTRAARSAAERRLALNEAIRRHRAGELATAEVLYRQVLEDDPDNFEALHMLAVIGNQSDQLAGSIELFEKAARLQPDNPALLVNYGATLRKAKRFDEALAVYDRALALQPDLQEALYNKAQCLMPLGRSAEAAEYYRRSLARKPDHVDSRASLGNALLAMGRWDEAIQNYEAALALNPHFIPALIDMAIAFRSKRWYSSARLLLEKAVAIDPRHAGARAQLSLLLLSLGDLEAGWKSYEGRFWYSDQKVPRRPVPPMYWDGEDLSGKSILIWSEQGVGDEILFSTMLPDVVARAGKVYLACDARMAPVYRRSFPGNLETLRLFEIDALLRRTPIDYQIAFGSLGRLLRPSFASFPRRRGHLRAAPEAVADFKARYGAKPVVGVSWRSFSPVWGLKKSTRLVDWAPILRQPDVTFVCLQYGDVEAELREVRDTLGVEVVSDPAVDQLKDMDGFFAQVAAMDLVISTSSTTVHVAGALAVPTWVMLPQLNALHWYWFLSGDSNPFYSSLRLFRRDEGADWPSVLQEVSAAFADWRGHALQSH
jgi:tetratricopeptide (TPR) repeat protein